VNTADAYPTVSSAADNHPEFTSLFTDATNVDLAPMTFACLHCETSSIDKCLLFHVNNRRSVSLLS
jgi:hypothetical protein